MSAFRALAQAMLRWAFRFAVMLTAVLEAHDILTAPQFRNANGWVAHSWDTANGMPENSATAITQTPDGYLWIGTFRGLVRFDGAKSHVYHHNNTPALEDDAIINLHHDRKNRLWISTARGITVREPDGRFESAGYSAGWPKDTYVRFWYESADGTLYAVLFSREVLRFAGGRWETLPPFPRQDPGLINLYEEVPGKLQAVRPDQDYELTGTTWVPGNRIDRGRDGPVMRICRSRRGGTWFLAHRALVHRQGGEETERRPLPLWTTDIWSMEEDSAGNIWICSFKEGLLRLNPAMEAEHFGYGEGLKADDVRQVFEDRQKVIWVGTSGGGLVRMLPRVIRPLMEPEGLTNASVLAIQPTAAGVLIGTRGRGVRRWNGRQFEPMRERGWDVIDDKALVFSLAADREGTVWVAIDRGRVARIAQGRGTIERPVPESSRWVEETRLFASGNGRIWLGYDHGLSYWEDGTWNVVGGVPELHHILCFAQATNGGPLYAGSTRTGLFRIEDGQVRRYGTNDGLPSESLSSLCFDPEGALWIATDNGMARLKDGRITTPRPGNAMDADGIERMLPDTHGRLWLASRTGLIAATLEDLNAACEGKPGLVAHHHYSTSDGLPSTDFQPGAARMDDGTLWFGTSRGVAVVSPHAHKTGPGGTGVRVEEVSYSLPQDGGAERVLQPPAGTRSVELPPGAQRIRVSFTAFDSAAAHMLDFDYRLSDDARPGAWLQAGTERSLELGDLTPGAHELSIRAYDSNGRLDPEQARIVIDVGAMFWQTRWFQALVLIGLASAITLGVSRVQARALERRRRALQREETLLRDRAEALRGQELFRRLIDQAHEGVYVLETADGRFLDANDTAVRMLGYPKARLLAMKAADIANPARPLDWAGQMESLRAAGRLTFESAQRRSDGTSLPVEVDLQLSRVSGEEFVVAFVRDITERLEARERQRALEEQLREAQKMEAIGCLAGGVAHDFNNLLQAIGGFAELARMDGPAREREEHLVEIGRTVSRGSQLTRQLLAFSRKQEAEMKELDLNVVAEHSIRLLSRLVGADIRIALRPSASPARVRGDSTQIEQVLLNLTVNARDAMPAGGELDITVGEAVFGADAAPSWARPGRFVRLTVRDNGCGIDPAVQDRIFEPFFTTKPQGKGTGLGLAVVYGNVQQHDGFIRVDSRPGEGTAFEIYLPALPARDTPADTAGTPAPRPARGGTILFCDDEPGVRKAGCMILEGAGYRVLAAADGREAVEQVLEAPGTFALVIMDVMMPGIDGPEAVRRIRAARPDMPVLFISGFSGTALAADGGLPGNAELLAKPYAREELIEAVLRSLGRPA